MLIQELGEQRRLTQDDHLRLSAQEESWQLERKRALSFAQGAGGIEWVWNVNATMANDNGIPIGALRPDGTEKPEADVVAGFAQFAARSPESFASIDSPEVTMVTSQSLLYTGMNAIALATQKGATSTSILRPYPLQNADRESPDRVRQTQASDPARPSGAH